MICADVKQNCFSQGVYPNYRRWQKQSPARVGLPDDQPRRVTLDHMVTEIINGNTAVG
jgi:hypothetical protein